MRPSSGARSASPSLSAYSRAHHLRQPRTQGGRFGSFKAADFATAAGSAVLPVAAAMPFGLGNPTNPVPQDGGAGAPVPDSVRTSTSAFASPFSAAPAPAIIAEGSELRAELEEWQRALLQERAHGSELARQQYATHEALQADLSSTQDLALHTAQAHATAREQLLWLQKDHAQLQRELSLRKETEKAKSIDPSSDETSQLLGKRIANLKTDYHELGRGTMPTSSGPGWRTTSPGEDDGARPCGSGAPPPWVPLDELLRAASAAPGAAEADEGSAHAALVTRNLEIVELKRQLEAHQEAAARRQEEDEQWYDAAEAAAEAAAGGEAFDPRPSPEPQSTDVVPPGSRVLLVPLSDLPKLTSADCTVSRNVLKCPRFDATTHGGKLHALSEWITLLRNYVRSAFTRAEVGGGPAIIRTTRDSSWEGY